MSVLCEGSVSKRLCWVLWDSGGSGRSGDWRVAEFSSQRHSRLYES